MISFEVFIVVTAIVANIFLALFTLFKNPRSATNILFFLFTIALILYLPANYLLSQQATATDAFWWVKVVMTLALFINILYFLLAATFPHNKITLRPFIFWLCIGATLPLLVLAPKNLVFSSVEAYGKSGVPGMGMPLFLLHTVLFLGGALIILVKKLRQSVGIEKTQIKLFLLGTAIMFGAILVTNLFFVLIFNTGEFVGLLPLYTIIFVGFISYAIIRHRFMDIRFVVARTIAYALLVTLLGVVFSAGVFIASSIFLSRTFEMSDLIVLTVFALIIGFSRGPLSHVLNKVSERVFYKGVYDSQFFLAHLSKILAQTIELDQISKSILDELLNTMKISKVGIVLVRDSKTVWSQYVGGNFSLSREFVTHEIPHFISWLVKKPGENILVYDELSSSNEKVILRDSEISVFLALVVKNKPIGAIVLGEKSSGDIYSSQDIKVLNIIAPEIAVAINNSLSYEEIKRFNITLKEEVDKATADLKSANERLKELDKLKDEFVSLASHELRTPMTVIKSYIWLLLDRKSGQINDKQKMYLERTFGSVERLINLVNDMLNVSRIESGRMLIEKVDVDIENLVTTTLDELRAKADELQLHLSVVNKKDQLAHVFADPDKIKQVLLNLIGNSLKFTPAGGAITVALDEKDGAIEVAVIDTGQGIKAEDMDKLFKKFGMLGKNYLSKQGTQGTGLGLYLTKSIVELHGGNINVTSEGEGKGTTFSFTLPINAGSAT